MTRMQLKEATGLCVLSMLFGTILVLLLGEAHVPRFVETWSVTKMLWATMVTGCLGISAVCLTYAIDTLRARSALN